MNKLFDLSDYDQSGSIDVKELQHVLHCVYKDRSNNPIAVSKSELLAVMASAGGVKKMELTRGKVCESLVLDRATFLRACRPPTGSSNTENKTLVHYIKPYHATRWVVSQDLMSSYVSAAVQLLLLFHAPVSAKAFLYFDCNTIGTEHSFLRQDYQLECYSDQWWSFAPVALLLMVGFAFALPLWLGGYLVVHRNDLHTPATRHTIGWLYSRFHTGSEGWEIFEVFRKMILTGMLVYLPSTTRASVAILICVIAIAVLNYKKPHRNVFLFWVAESSFLCTAIKYLVTVFGAASLSSSTEAMQDNNMQVLGMVLILLDCITFFFGLLCVVLVFVVLRKDVQRINEADAQTSSATHIMPLPELKLLPDTPEQRPRVEREVQTPEQRPREDRREVKNTRVSPQPTAPVLKKKHSF